MTEPDPGELAAELSSSSPGRISAALVRLDQAGRRRPVTAVPMPEVSLLDAFGERPPEDVVVLFVDVVLSYPLYVPWAERKDRLTTALEAALRYGPGQPAYDLARFVRASDSPATVVDELMSVILDADVEKASQLDTLSQIVDVLLDARATHAAVVRGLESWAFRGRYPTVIEQVSRALAPAERARLTESD